MLVGGGKGATCRRTVGAGADGVMIVMQEECDGLGDVRVELRQGCCLRGRCKFMQVAVNTTVRATVRGICWILLSGLETGGQELSLLVLEFELPSTFLSLVQGTEKGCHCKEQAPSKPNDPIY